LLGLLASFGARAAAIDCSITSLGGQNWRCDYVVSNDGTSVIDEFTIFYDHNFYSNLSLAASPTGWDSIVVPPDLGLPSDGFFDSLAQTSGIAPGTSLGGFTVFFTFTGSGAPGAQRFEIVDPETFASIYSGMTTVNSGNSVPEPGTLPLLFIAGLLAAASCVRRRQ
jgi:hypothetical protein